MKRDVLVGLREHLAGVELDSETRRMRPGQCRRHHDARTGVRLLDVGIGNAVGVAIGEAEIGALLPFRDAVEFVLRARRRRPSRGRCR